MLLNVLSQTMTEYAMLCTVVTNRAEEEEDWKQN